MAEVTVTAVVRTYAVAALHLVRNPFLPAYARYYDVVGAVVGFSGDLVRVQVYGVHPGGSEWWALQRKPRPLR
jgi:hypothetical protein